MAEEKQAEKTNAAAQATAAPQETAAVENAIEVYTDKAQFLTKQTQKQIEQSENPARAKLTGFTIKVLKRNKNNGGIDKIVKALNESMIAARKEFVAKETSIAEKEAKMDAKFNEVKVSEGNNNILVLKAKELIKRATDPAVVNPILVDNQVELTNYMLESKGKTEQGTNGKAKPLMIQAVLKEQLETIGSKPRSYVTTNGRVGTVSGALVIEGEEPTAQAQVVEEKPVVKKRKNAKWKKVFKSVSDTTEVEEPSVIDLKPVVEVPAVDNNGIVSLAEYKRRKTIWEAGRGVNDIVSLNANLGENEQISSALLNRKNKLEKIISDLANVTIPEKGFTPVVEEKPEFQTMIDELLNVKEPMSREEHDELEAEYNRYFSDPFVEEQLRRQQLEGILYEYNNPENYRKIMEAERAADRQLSAKLQEDANKLVAEEPAVQQEATQSKTIELKDSDAKVQATMLYEKNLVADAVEEVKNEYVRQIQGVRTQAEMLLQKQLVEDAIREVVESVAKSLKEKNKDNVDYQKAGALQAEMIMQKDLVNAAVGEVVESYKKLKSDARTQAEMIMQRDLRDAAVEEVVAEYKASVTEKPEVDYKADAMKEAARLNETNKAIDAAHEEVEKNRDAYAEIFRKKAEERKKKKSVISAAEKRIGQLKIKKLAQAEARRINREQQKEFVIEDAHKTAKKLFINNIRAYADETARNINLKLLKNAGEVQAKDLITEAMREEGREEARKINNQRLQAMGEEEAKLQFKAIQEEASKSLVVYTDVNESYLRELQPPKKVKLGGVRFSSFADNSKKNYSGSEERQSNMIVSLREQLSELGLGSEEPETSYGYGMKFAA